MNNSSTAALAAFVALFTLVTPTANVLADEGDDILRDLKALQKQEQGGPVTKADLDALVEQTLPRVSKVMGLSAPSHVNVKVLTRDEARTKLLGVLTRDYPGDTLKRLGEALAAVGLSDANVDLTRAAQDMYGGNVSGFYDPHDRVLFLLADQPMEAQMLIVAHELAHAIQDEHMQLDAAMLRVRPSEDAQLALSAAIEGQAQAVASLVTASQLTDALGAEGGKSTEIADMLSDSTASSASMAASQASVPWLGMQMSFPYSAGAKLVNAVRKPDDPSARSLLKRVPVSTAQVLTPSLYQRDERPREATLDLVRRLPGSELVYATTLGRANLDLFGQLHNGGELLGEGWRGDRLEVVRLGGKIVAAWAVSFSSADQAERLQKAWSAALHARGSAAAVQPDGSSYVVQRSGSTAVLLENMPDAQLADVQAASLAAFK